MGSLVAGGWPELFTKRERYLALLLMIFKNVHTNVAICR